MVFGECRCFWLWLRPLFVLFCCFPYWRNANLAGRFACRRFCCLILFCVGFALNCGTKVFHNVCNLLQGFPSVSKVAGVWRSLSWCLESVMPWRGIMGFTKFGDKRINDLGLLQGYVVGVACFHREIPCRRICIHLASRTS